MVGKVEIKPGQTLAAQFREKGAVELGGLILVEIGRRECRAALSLSIYRLPSKPLGKADAGKKDDVYQSEEIVSFRNKKENRSAESSREGEGRGRMEEWTRSGAVVVVTSK